MGLKDTLSEASMVLREWKNLPRRVDNSVMSRVTKKPMSDKLTPIDKKIRLPVFTTLMFSTALAACARISSELPNTASPVADNGPRTATAAPTNEALGVQFGEVAVWDKATLAAKDANVSAQIDALSGELRKQRPDLFVGNTQLESFAISVPAKDMTGKKTNTIYPFIVGNNQTDRNKSFVTIVLRRLDGQGIFAQSLTPVDIDVDGQQRGALVLPTSDTEQLPIFIFPKSLKDWNAQSDAQKVASDVIFIPPTGDRVKIPLSGGKLASPAVYNAQVGYATPGFSPDRIATASATDFYKTQTPTATNAPTETATQAPTATSTSRPTSTQAPTNRPAEATATPRPTEAQNGLPADWPAWIRQHPEYGWYKIDDINGGLWSTLALPDDVCKDIKLPNRLIRDWPYDPSKPQFEKNKTYVKCSADANGFIAAFQYNIR